MSWFVYILRSATNGRLYTGISTSPTRRLDQHNGKTQGGAKSTRAGRPWSIVHTETLTTKGGALRREAAIKKLPRSKKLALAGLA